MRTLWRGKLEVTLRLWPFRIALALLPGCSESLYGVGNLVVWNGTESRVTVKVEGRTSEEFVVLSGTSKVLPAVAGPYNVSVQAEGAEAQIEELELAKETNEVINVSAASCFARVDASGNYQSGKPRFVVLGTYEATPRLSLRDTIYVFPGEALPPTRSKSAMVFQQLTTIDCALVGDKAKIAEVLRDRR